MKIINANGLILGRVASVAAKASLLGEQVVIYNCEHAAISGTKRNILAKQKLRYDRGTHVKGPFYERTAHLFVKRTIRGMLPYKQEKGRKAFARIKCYQGVPKALAGQPAETVKGADASRLTSVSYITVHHLTRHLGHD